MNFNEAYENVYEFSILVPYIFIYQRENSTWKVTVGTRSRMLFPAGRL